VDYYLVVVELQGGLLVVRFFGSDFEVYQNLNVNDSSKIGIHQVNVVLNFEHDVCQDLA